MIALSWMHSVTHAVALPQTNGWREDGFREFLNAVLIERP